MILYMYPYIMYVYMYAHMYICIYKIYKPLSAPCTFFLQYSFCQCTYSIAFSDLWLITIAPNKETPLFTMQKTLHRAFSWAQVGTTQLPGKIEDDLKWMGLKQFFRIPLLVDLKLNIFLVYHPEMGLFSEYRKIHFSKEGIQHAQNMMQNVENMTKHWSSLDLWFCIALFQRNLPYQPSAS